jgi:hypothetical protein
MHHRRFTEITSLEALSLRINTEKEGGGTVGYGVFQVNEVQIVVLAHGCVQLCVLH